MARISVVVPIYDVEPYLDECLRSVAAQTFEDLDVVMVDDGSTDGSAAIAERHARTDPRFRLVRQPNSGLGAARNTGMDLATGEFLAFLDSDDVLPPDAYERLLRTLQLTGSDFAGGNVLRLTGEGLVQAPFLARTFAATRLRTHVRRFEPLLADRTAWNKLWRRRFWDSCGFRFPEGRLHEDIPVVVPAHFRARSVDVLAAPVYHWRLREGDGAPSITQRRRELRALEHRLAAVEEVCADLARHESARQLRRYQRSVVAHDLRYHLDVLHEAGDDYRALFMRRANAFLDAADRRVLDRLPAIERAKWELVRRRRLPELLELLRFQHEGGRHALPERRLGRYYARYPVPDLAPAQRRLGRRDQELALVAHLEDLRFAEGKLRLAGHAYVNALGAAGPERQRLALGAVRAGGVRALRMRTVARPIPTAPVRRGDLEPGIRWAGFQASLDLAALPVDEELELFAVVRAGGIRRRRARFAVAAGLAGTVDLPLAGGRLAIATLTPSGRASVRLESRWVRLERHRLLPAGRLELAGRTHDGGFAALLDLADLPTGEGELPIATGGVPLLCARELSGAAWRYGGRGMTLTRTPAGGPRLLVEEPVRRAPATVPAVLAR